jgi:hypothetical protein
MSKKRAVCLMLFLAAIAIFVFLFPKLMWLAIIVTLLSGVIYFLNCYVVRKIQLQKAPFQINGSIRNVDYLLIGDMIDSEKVIPQGKSSVQIKAPNRSLFGAFEILKHTSSILDEDNGNVIIAVKNSELKNQFSVFDIPFLYNLTIKKYGIEKYTKLAKVPFLINPFLSIKLLLNICTKNWEEKECPDADIISFCDERNIHLMYFECQK